MTQNLNIAVVGATGLVGEAMIEILQERNFPVGTLHPLASERSLGKSVRFRGQELPVAVLDEHDFSALFDDHLPPYGSDPQCVAWMQLKMTWIYTKNH